MPLRIHACAQPRSHAELDTNLQDHLRNIAEIYDADAAADEQAAIREAKDNDMFPNMRFTLMDHTHAARRPGARRRHIQWQVPLVK